MIDRNNAEAINNAGKVSHEALERARRQLAEQALESGGEDLYAGIRESMDNSSQKAPIPPEEFPELRGFPEEVEELPELRMKPNEEELEDHPAVPEFDQPLFPDGPLRSQVDSWKKQYVGYDVYVAEVAGEYFVFRTLNRFEYKQLVALPNTDPLMREEMICQTCTLWPAKYKWDRMATGKAGVPSTYSQIIMEKSGFTKEFAIQIL